VRSSSRSYSTPCQSSYLSAITPSHHDFDPKYNWIDGGENLEKYEPGAYHPIMIGTLSKKDTRLSTS
jgi:hypothetical protein